ncbi:MAG: lipoprotein [Campylobacteraceae bacterium]
MRNNNTSLFHVFIITCLSLFFLSGCGYKGDPKHVDVSVTTTSQVK